MVFGAKNLKLTNNSMYLKMANNLVNESGVSPEEIIAQFISNKIKIPSEPGEGSFISGSPNYVTIQVEIGNRKSLK